DKASPELVLSEASPECYMQPNLTAPSSPHRERMRFEKDYASRGFEYVYRHKYHKLPFFPRMSATVTRVVRKLLTGQKLG
ncbi:MAG: hypothetical protein ACI399_03690, partial [Candidatus Cryptobacteroides sp.]